MNNTRRCLAGIAGALLVCLLIVGTVSAYDPDAACASLKEVIAGSGDLTALELVYDYSDGSVGCMKLWTESVITPDETLCASLERALGEERKANSISLVILTLVTGEKRVSYELSPEKSVFVKVKQQIEFPDLSMIKGTVDSDDLMNQMRYNYVLNHTAGKSLFGSSITFWAESDTIPDTTLPVMTAESWIKKWNGIRWVDSCYAGNTQWYTDDIAVQCGPVTLQSGTYKQIANFEGYHVDYVWYEESREYQQFEI